MNEPVLSLHRGTTPLLLSLPHVGTEIPPELQPRFVPRALEVEDTDWHLEPLYAFARELGATVLVPRYSRYVIDLNRPREDTPMYSGVNTTGLCPVHFFTGEPLYRPGLAPDAAELRRRIERYWQPYHDTLRQELQRLRAEHGHAVLFDGHSIKSELPWLFEGELPALNIGTADGGSCGPGLRQALAGLLAAQDEFSHVIDGRFKGGYITRHYGRPAEALHAVQLEMCWRCYMAEDAPYRLDGARVARIEPLLRRMLQLLIAWRPDGS
ncbi:N-formylglutamate deformylase [Azohydromonas caseinilytica]|uniref:N-formylglutamate deformylase n=1 Tax=Azohydromonas caseinilytica TaxID=2728836 RepID=A0A848F984_9BURK|nr:N-formylglutamate deformylase [Azohydromonas caseinilytica]NML14800.1 N-formylglutamate deformylase [Azohydromonas caseinilytica]